VAAQLAASEEVLSSVSKYWWKSGAAQMVSYNVFIFFKFD
jgi:hypothetical protein